MLRYEHFVDDNMACALEEEALPDRQEDAFSFARIVITSE